MNPTNNPYAPPTQQKADCPAASCSAYLTPETDASAYEATTRTVGKWIVPISKARKIERDRSNITELILSKAREERRSQACGETPMSRNMHGYAANRLESVLLAIGLSIPQNAEPCRRAKT